MRALLCFTIATSLWLQSVAASTCYPASSTANLRPCDNTTSTSSCCPSGWYCYSNGLCQDPTTTALGPNRFTYFHAFGCTDSQASSGECLAYYHCSRLAPVPGTGVQICSAGTYACYGTGGGDCNNASQVFSLPQGYIISSIPAIGATATSAAISSASSSQSSASDASSASSTASPTPTSNGGSSNNSVAVGVGAGVGIAVGLLLLAGIGFWFWRRHRRSTAHMQPAAPHQSEDISRYGYGGDAKHSSPYPMSPQVGVQNGQSHEAQQLLELEAASSPAQLPDENPGAARGGLK